MLGGAGNDLLSGGIGNDTLDGGTGFDTLDGGEGDDTYWIRSAEFDLRDAFGNDTTMVSASFVKLPSFIENVSHVDGAQALPYWIDALLPDDAAGNLYQRLLGPTHIFGYAFPTTLPAYNTDVLGDGFLYQGFNNAQKAFARLALNAVEAVVDVRYVLVADPAAVNVIAFGNNEQPFSSAYANYPSDEFIGGDVFLDTLTPANLAPTDGSYAALTLIHELGHTLGLEHPFIGSSDAPYLSTAEDTTGWTVMSYTDSPAQYHLAFSPLDIAALQYLYGPSKTARTGNDTYLVSATAPNFVWDGGGIDTLSASGLAQAVILYLEPGYWGYVGSKADRITAPGQVTVNFGSAIENLLEGPAQICCMAMA